MNKKIKILLIIISLTILTPFGITFAISNDFGMIIAVINLIKKSYVKEVEDKKLIESAISGMLTSLDPHSNFVDTKELEELKESVKGEFGGIGVEIVAEPQGLRVISPIDDTPAAKAGIQAKDLIFAINDELIGNMTQTEAIKKMRGPKGTELKISVLREGLSEPLEVKLKRDIIKVIPVKSHMYGNFAYIRISTFSNLTASSLEKSIHDLKQNSKEPIKGVVIDLRNNPGGILEQSAEVTDFFLPKGKIVSIKDREMKETKLFEASGKTLIDDKTPIVVLINGGSASASEIVAGALQDNKRAIIAGTKSFGKGSVQSIIEVPGYGAVRLTTNLYYTPSGKSIQAEGIIPDIIIEPAKIELLNKEKKQFLISEASLKNHLRTGNQVDSSPDTKNLSIKSKEEFWTKLYEQDYQLARAIDILKSMDLLKKW